MAGGIFIILFPTQVSLVSFLQEQACRNHSSLGELLGQRDIVCIRSKITQSTIKTTKKTAESTNMSCSLKNAFYHRTRMDQREDVLFSLLSLWGYNKRVKYKKPIGKLCTFKIILLQVTMCTTEVLSLIKVKSCL